MLKIIKNAFAFFTKRNEQNVKLSSAFAHRSLIASWKLYAENPCVRRSVSVIAAAVASIKFRLFKGNEEIFEHRLIHLLNKPNFRDSWASLIEAAITHFVIHGNAYFVFLQDKEEIHLLRPEKVRILPGEYGVPLGYEYSIDAKNVFAVDPSGFCPVGHLKVMNPYDDWYGLSMLDSLKFSANLHNAITLHNLALIQNGGRLSGVVCIKNNSAPLSDEDKRKFAEHLANRFEGAENAGRIAFIEGGDFEWKEMGLNPKDMDYTSAKNLAAREIAESLGVPAMLIGGIGISGESARANYKEVTERFYEGTVLPMAEKLFCLLNNWLICKIDPNLSLKMNLDEFLPLHDKRFELWEKVSSAGFLSNNEKRKILGFKEVE